MGILIARSPWVDLEYKGKSMLTVADASPMLKREGALQMARTCLSGAEPKTPKATTLYAELSGLP